MTVEPIASTPEVTAKVVEGALRAVARFGLTKLTVDDVAREAGISRATLYRYFPGRSAVLAAVVRSETERLQRGLDEALGETTTLAEALAAVVSVVREFVIPAAEERAGTAGGSPDGTAA